MWAQTEAVSTWPSTLPGIASVGFAVVVAWYLLTKVIPRLQDRQDQTLKDQQQVGQAIMLAAQGTFERTIKELQDKYDRHEELRRVENKAGLDAVLQHCREESMRSVELHKVEMAVLQRQLQQNSEILEDIHEKLLEQEVRRRENRQRQQKPPPPSVSSK